MRMPDPTVNTKAHRHDARHSHATRLLLVVLLRHDPPPPLFGVPDLDSLVRAIPHLAPWTESLEPEGSDVPDVGMAGATDVIAHMLAEARSTLPALPNHLLPGGRLDAPSRGGRRDDRHPCRPDPKGPLARVTEVADESARSGHRVDAEDAARGTLREHGLDCHKDSP